MGTGKYLLDREHFPLYPDFEDKEVVMNEDDPSSVQAQEKKEKARKEKASKMLTQEEASEYFLENKQEQLAYLIASTLRIEKGLATLTQNQESLERIMVQKFYDLDVKVTEIQSVVEQLQDDMQERKVKTTTNVFARAPRAQRSATVPVPDTRATSSAPATAPTAPVQPPPAPTPPAPPTSIEAFVQGAISTPPT